MLLPWWLETDNSSTCFQQWRANKELDAVYGPWVDIWSVQPLSWSEPQLSLWTADTFKFLASQNNKHALFAPKLSFLPLLSSIILFNTESSPCLHSSLYSNSDERLSVHTLSHSHSLSLSLSLYLSLSLSFSLPISHSHAIWHSKVYIYYSPSPLCLLFGLSSNDRHFLDVERTKQPQVLLPLNRKSAAIDTGHQKIDLKKFCLITDSETRYSITIATMKLPDGKTSLGMEMKYVFLLLAWNR